MVSFKPKEPLGASHVLWACFLGLPRARTYSSH